MDKVLPKQIKEKCSDFKIPIDKKIWALNVPTTKMKITTLNWLFENPFWKYKQKWYAISPNEVIANKRKYPNHWRRIQKADLNYPIDIMKNNKGYWEILDGLHRLAKAKVLGLTYVKVRKVPLSEVKKLIR